MYVYLLQHSYLIDNESNTYETKIIGIYSSIDKALKTKEKYKNIKGFNEHSTDFYIDKYKINENHWIEGFIGYNKFDKNEK